MDQKMREVLAGLLDYSRDTCADNVLEDLREQAAAILDHPPVTAKAVPGHHVVAASGTVDGEEWLTLALENTDTYQSFKRLPNALEFHGRLYGKTGYNSDTLKAYYSTNVHMARNPNQRKG